MKTVVITGSTHGIGYGLADALLERGCNVVVNGRRQASVDEAVAGLSARHGADNVSGFPGDAADFNQVQALWNAAIERFGRVDIWINNAGISNFQARYWTIDPDEIAGVIETNLLGAMYGSRVALAGMLEQGGGALYNMGGAGSRGGHSVPGLAPYETSKAGLAYFTKALAAEAKETPVIVGLLLPGMVLTNMLTGQEQKLSPQDWQRVKNIINILADRVETVAPWMAEEILKNDKNGAFISYLNNIKATTRFLMAPFRKGRLLK